MDMMLICVGNDGVVDSVQSPSAPGPNHKYICFYDTCTFGGPFMVSLMMVMVYLRQ